MCVIFFSVCIIKKLKKEIVLFEFEVVFTDNLFMYRSFLNRYKLRTLRCVVFFSLLVACLFSSFFLCDHVSLASPSEKYSVNKTYEVVSSDLFHEGDSSDQKSPTASSSQFGWARDRKGFYYRFENGDRAFSQWINTEHGFRYVTETGYSAFGWYKTPNGKWWYFDTNGYARFGVLTNLSYPYYIDFSNGLFYNSWIKSNNGSWMHTDDNGILVTGWYKTPNGKWWYFDKQYKLVTGKLTINNRNYWLDVNAGLLYDSWAQDLQGNWIHTNDSGCLVTGWYKTSNGKWWYFGNDFKMVIGQLNDHSCHYWLDSSAGLLYNDWVKTDDGSWMHTDDSGCLVKGWYQTPNGKWWYFGNDFKMITGEYSENGHHYWLDPNNGLSCNTWIQDASGSWFYTDNIGNLATGWCHTSNNKWFYFDPQSNRALFGDIVVNGTHYYIDETNGLDLEEMDNSSVEAHKNWLLRAASGEIGYEAYKDPQPGSKYGRWMADKTDTPWLRGPSSEVWWCAIFVSWCFDQAHVSWDALPSYNCDQIYSRALNDGRSQILSDVHDCKPGDIVLYNFHGGSSCQHIGIIESNNGSTITTIEGNTSSGDGGSQHAGNGVWRRTRPFTYVRAIVRPYPFV